MEARLEAGGAGAQAARPPAWGMEARYGFGSCDPASSAARTPPHARPIEPWRPHEGSNQQRPRAPPPQQRLVAWVVVGFPGRHTTRPLRWQWANRRLRPSRRPRPSWCQPPVEREVGSPSRGESARGRRRGRRRSYQACHADRRCLRGGCRHCRRSPHGCRCRCHHMECWRHRAHGTRWDSGSKTMQALATGPPPPWGIPARRSRH